MRVFWIRCDVVVMYVAAAGCEAFCFDLCCLIVGEIFSSLPSCAVSAEWEGDAGGERCVRGCMNCHFDVGIDNVST